MDNDRRERFELLYRGFGGQVLAYALRRSTPEVANDVFAETFLVAWRRLEAVPDDPLPWLLVVARRKLSNARRSSIRFEALRDRLAREPTPSGLAEELPPGSDLVFERLRCLPERHREALLLVAWEGLTDTQAAQVLRCSPTAFRLRLHRARNRLVKELRAVEPKHTTESILIERREAG